MSAASDLWSFGCIVHQMLTGTFAFNDATSYLILQKIKNFDYAVPEDVDEEAQDLIGSLIVTDPSKRLVFASLNKNESES